jgi:sporulation protein YlmC with PRC-barrel domain
MLILEKPTILSASALVGNKVKNQNGDLLGEIDELMIDPEEGRISYAVIRLEKSWGFGEKLFPIPWSLLVGDPEDGRFRLEIDRQTLEEAPGFNKNYWPRMITREWLENLYLYYEIPPYWY